MIASRMPWIKLYTNPIDDPRPGCLSDDYKWRCVQLMVLAGGGDAEATWCRTATR